jgi:ABC-type microcin C transport system permease subunit YejE
MKREKLGRWSVGKGVFPLATVVEVYKTLPVDFLSCFIVLYLIWMNYLICHSDVFLLYEWMTLVLCLTIEHYNFKMLENNSK